MNSQFNVVFTGELKPGTDRDAFIKAFSQRFQCSEEKAAKLLESNTAITMKTAVEKDVAEKFRDVLDDMGMMIRLDPLPSKRATFQSSEPAANQQATTAQAAASTAATNPYQAPEADLHEDFEEGEMTGPVSVPFGHGFSWISSAFSNHFWQNPWAWMGATVIFVILSLVTQIIPLLGPIASTLLYPVFFAGLMIGAQAQDEGEDFTVGHLFSGFQQETGQLILFGVLYLVATLVVFLIAGAIIGGSFATLSMAVGGGDQASMDAMMQNPMTILTALLVILLLFVPLGMTYWFAPALIALNGVSAMDAMKMSFVGCLKNMLPFLLYSIILGVLSMIAMIPIGLGFLVLIPVMFASMYTAYRDIFYPEA